MITAATPVRFLWTYVQRRPMMFSSLTLAVTGAAICAVGVQYGMKLIVDAMTMDDRSTGEIWRWLGVFIALIAVESMLWRISGWLGCRTVVATGVDIRLDLFRHLAGHPMQFFSGHLAGSLGNRITATAGATGAIFTGLVWKIVPPCVDFVGALVVAATIDLRMSATLVAGVAAVAGLITLFGIRGRPLHQEYARQGARVGGEIVDVVANMWSVKAFAARDREYGHLREAFEEEATAQRRSWLYLEKARVLHDLCLLAMAGSMLAWAIHSWRNGNSTPGDVVVISALTFRILHGSRDLALSLVEASQQLAAIREMLGVVAGPHRIADAPNAREFVPGAGSVSLKNVHYGYDDGPAVLRGLTLHIPAGQRIGIVGPSGAGKSTLVALIQRLDDVRSGHVEIDGQRIAEVTQESLRHAIAVVPQDISLFHRSIRENIRYGRPDASDEEVMQAARLAHCEVFIDALPAGYDTIVGERGTRLSGGQRQRIGIARAFLKNASILILDEATSALDSASEAEIQQALIRLMHGRTVIAVAHRLATVSSFDRVVVLEAGAICEDGPPDELRTLEDGHFARMWALQAEGFETA
jgi:ATP-binding cassette subfamily B protein